MTTFCLSCPAELPHQHSAAVAHFAERGVDARFINAIHGETFGILAWRPYRHNRPNAGELTDISQVGLTLSHYMAWTVCQFYRDEIFLILEDDAEFPVNWQTRLQSAMRDLPEDWDILLIGSSHCSDKEQTHVKGEIFDVRYPFCTHAMLINKKALPVLLERCRDAAMKIDIALLKLAYPHLKVFTVLPRIVGQRGVDLAE
jgi:GR25 family glycosyltransferase involved in LPS biosynthesis